MLGIHRVGPGRADYYLSDLAVEVGAPGPGRWAGMAAEGLGLTGALDAAAFRALLSGQHPNTRHRLRAGRGPVCAYDLTFSAPKSVSVLFGLGGPDVAQGVLAAQAQAVDSALRYLEQQALSAVRESHSVRTVVPVSGATAGVFTHGVSRAADPHVHSHVVLANLVHGVDARWSSTDQRALFAHRRAAAAVYDGDLRAALAGALGVRWAPAGAGGYEVRGVSSELRGAFSTRSGDIRRRGHETGARSRRGRMVVWAATRPPKVDGVDAAALRREWAQRARDVGAGPHLPEEVLGRPASRSPLDEHRYAAGIVLAAHGGAYRRDVVAAFGRSAPDGIDHATLAHAVEAWVPPAPAEAVGVAEPLQPRRAVLPANHLLRALGPRPTTRRAYDLWLDAARAIDAYRERWGLQRAPGHEALGPGDPAALAAMSGARLADHLRTARHLDETRVRLGRGHPASTELGLAR